MIFIFIYFNICLSSFSIFYDLFWILLDIFIFEPFIFMFASRLEYWYSICIYYSFTFFKPFYSIILIHFYSAFSPWRKNYFLSNRQKFFFVFRWVTGVSPIFYFCLFILIILHFLLFCPFYCFGCFVLWNYSFVLSEAQLKKSKFKKYFNQFITFFIVNFMDIFIFIISFLSFYRFILWCIFKLFVIIDLITLTFLQSIVNLVFLFIFNCKRYYWKFFHLRRAIMWNYYFYKKFYRNRAYIPYRLLLTFFQYIYFLLKNYTKYRELLLKNLGILINFIFYKYIYYSAIFYEYFYQYACPIIFDIYKYLLLYIFLSFCILILIGLKISIIYYFMQPNIYNLYSASILHTISFPLLFFKYYFSKFLFLLISFILNFFTDHGLVTAQQLSQPSIVYQILFIFFFFFYIFFKIFSFLFYYLQLNKIFLSIYLFFVQYFFPSLYFLILKNLKKYSLIHE
jgi:hypothetical protein